MKENGQSLSKFNKKLLIFNLICAMIEPQNFWIEGFLNADNCIIKIGETMKRETVIWITKYLLDIMYFSGIIVTLLLPALGVVQHILDFFDYHNFEGHYTELIVIYFILGIMAVLILGELRKMFRTVLQEDCFVKDNVVSLQRMGTYSFMIAVICLLRTVLYMTIAMLVLVLVFIIAGLFSKVLAFVFDRAVEYKLENDLTI